MSVEERWFTVAMLVIAVLVGCAHTAWTRRRRERELIVPLTLLVDNFVFWFWKFRQQAL